MQFVKSFSRVTREDYDTVGYLASDLALIHENNFKIPLTFVITSNAYHNFLEKNGLRNKLLQIYHGVTTDEQLELAYKEVKKLFLTGELPAGLSDEVFETYHSIGESGNFSASNIIQQKPNPRVMLMKSPSYIMEEEDMSGVFLNVQGEELLVKAIKLCWASLFSPESAVYRLNNNIKMPGNCGIIIQQFLTRGKNAIVRVNNKKIFVEAYLGIMDTHDELNKDHFIIDREYLQILESEIKFQQYRISVEDEKLVRYPQKQEGGEQKLNDKEIMEAARTAKRITNYLGKNCLAHMTMLDDNFLVKVCYRRTSPEPVELVEPTREEEKIIEEVQEEIKEFEEAAIGEVSETHIAMQVEDNEEDEELEFVSLEEDFPQEKIPLSEKTESEHSEISQEEMSKKEVPEVEVYELENKFEDALEEETIFPEEDLVEDTEFNTEPVVEVYEEPKVEVFQEPETPRETITEEVEVFDDFIMQMPEDTKKEEPVIQEKPKDVFDASNLVIKVFKELVDVISKKYYDVYGNMPESFGEGVTGLGRRMNISEQDLMEVKRLRDEYTNNNKALSTAELKFVLDTGAEAIRILKQ